METDYLIDTRDARTYAMPIANIIGKRINRISNLNTKLASLIAKLYVLPDNEDKTELCNEISKIIAEIELLVLKNIDDSQILEYSLAEFTVKSIKTEERTPNPDARDQHFYFA